MSWWKDELYRLLDHPLNRAIGRRQMRSANFEASTGTLAERRSVIWYGNDRRAAPRIGAAEQLEWRNDVLAEQTAKQALCILIMDLGYSLDEPPVYGHHAIRHQVMWEFCKQTLPWDDFEAEARKLVADRDLPQNRDHGAKRGQ